MLWHHPPTASGHRRRLRVLSQQQHLVVGHLTCDAREKKQVETNFDTAKKKTHLIDETFDQKFRFFHTAIFTLNKITF